MDFDELMNYIIILVILGALLIWLFKRPKMYCNETTLYITKGKANIEVSLSNI